MARYSSVAFPIYCYRNILPARLKLPQEAGFIWWFRFNYSLSSTIWNQCSWRKNACLHQGNGPSGASEEKKRKSRSSFCGSANLSPPPNQVPQWDSRGLSPRWTWETNAQSHFKGRNSAVIMFIIFVSGEQLQNPRRFWDRNEAKK